MRGRALRLLLLHELLARQDRSVTVVELAGALAARGYPLAGRPSKVISDTLRTEVLRGHVVQPGRGRYRVHHVPPTTVRRTRILAWQCQGWIGAVQAGQVPPAMPPDPRMRSVYRPNPYVPPWASLGWLWRR